MSKNNQTGGEDSAETNEFENVEFNDELQIRLGAGGGVFFVETSDRSRLQIGIAKVCEEIGFSYFEWNADQGLALKDKA